MKSIKEIKDRIKELEEEKSLYPRSGRNDLSERVIRRAQQQALEWVLEENQNGKS